MCVTKENAHEDIKREPKEQGRDAGKEGEESDKRKKISGKHIRLFLLVFIFFPFFADRFFAYKG